MDQLTLDLIEAIEVLADAAGHPVLPTQVVQDGATHAKRAIRRQSGTAFRIDDSLTGYLDRNGRDYATSSIGKHNALAVPSVYVVDASGEIVFDFVNADYRIRLPADELQAAATGAI